MTVLPEPGEMLLRTLAAELVVPPGVFRSSDTMGVLFQVDMQSQSPKASTTSGMMRHVVWKSGLRAFSLHHALADLSRLERSAIVVEAQYADFLNERRLAGRWPTARVARAFAELAVVHPRLPILFAGNRRLANQWTHRFFTAVATHWSKPQLDLVREAVADYRVQPSEPSIEERVRMAILSQDTMPVSLAEMVALLPEADTTRVRKELDRLTRAGILAKSGRGQAARWTAIKP